jgi:hypothetical protein
MEFLDMKLEPEICQCNYKRNDYNVGATHIELSTRQSVWTTAVRMSIGSWAA